ncbi:MAG: alpha-amylase family glycosyl hydrolase [Verrucomicrobiales bacterium]|nr:alpha-amylase family glycosyl hydrolase [Verrucomicrobiales bacterium]
MPELLKPRRLSIILTTLFLGTSMLHGREVILQYFNTSWKEIERRIPEIAEAGYSSLWLPPPFKGASGTYSVGFDTFDRFDLGDKDQMGTRSTRYGTRSDLLSLIQVAHRFALKVYFDNVMAHTGGPLDSDTQPGELFPGLPGFVPEDFHIGRGNGYWRKFSDSINWNDEWQVINRNPFSWDIAQEDWNTSFDAAGLLENNDFPKWRGVRHPGKTGYYLDTDLPVAKNFKGDPVFTFADKEPFEDTGYGPQKSGAGNGRFDWDDINGDGQHSRGEASEPFTDTGINPGNPRHRNAEWGFGDLVYNMGNPVEEDVNQMLFRQVRWFIDIAKADGFRLDAVKHVPDYFFGKLDGGDKDYSNWGYNGQIQEQFNISRGHTDWGNHRDSVFLNTLARDDALLFGEHLGTPPAWPPYLNSGMRVANEDFLNSIGSFNGIGHSLSDYDQPGRGTIGTTIGVSYALSHDNNHMAGAIRPAIHQYMLTREGLPIIYTDGYNIEGPPSYFPKPSYIPFLGQYGHRWVTGPLKVRRDFVRGHQIPRWSDKDFAAWEMRDKRENTAMSDADGTVVMLMMARNFTSGQARPVVTGFPVGARLRNYSEYGGAFRVNVGNDGRLRDDSGNFPVVPSGGYFAFSWDNPGLPSIWNEDPDNGAIEIYQGNERAPWLDHNRTDGRNGDEKYAHKVRIPRVTNGTNMRLLARADGSCANILMKLDGGIDINSAMGLGSQGSDKRDNPPPKDRFFENHAQDLFTGYEQMRFIERGVEKFAAKDTGRNVIGSMGSETWQVLLSRGNPPGISRNNGSGILTDTGTVDWVYHDPAANDRQGNRQLRVSPELSLRISVKVGYAENNPDQAWIYYTTDGQTYPEGSMGKGRDKTQVVRMLKSQDGAADNGGTPQWWVANLPPQEDNTLLRYKVGVLRSDAPDRFPFSRRDIDIKQKMETRFEVTGFNASNVPHYPHNDHGTMHTGLSEGFHILRTKSFLNRTGRSSIFKTQAQTFYYDTSRPSGLIVFPRENDTLGGDSYEVVITSDSTVTGVSYNILDSDPGNDSTAQGNGKGNWGQAHETTPKIMQGTLPHDKEWRFEYSAIPGSGTAVINVRLREISSSVNNDLADVEGHYTTRQIEINTGIPVNYRFGYPESDNQRIGEDYIAKVLFDKSLSHGTTDSGLISEFSVMVNGTMLPSSRLSIIRNETPMDDALAIRMPVFFDGNPERIHRIRCIHRRGDSTLSATRDFLAETTDLPDSDGDSLPDNWEHIHGLDANNPAGVHGQDGDFDHDGITNLGEFLTSGNPLAFETVNFSINAISRENGTALSLTFPVIANRHYRILHSTDLKNWLEAASFDALDSNPGFIWIDDGSLTGDNPLTNRKRFYSLEVSPVSP